MKKLLTFAAIVMIAATTRAAAIGWSIMGASAYANGAYNVFVVGINGVTDASQIAALVAAGTGVDSYAFYSGGTVNASGMASLAATASGKSITYSGSGTDTYQAFAILWTADGKEASYTSNASISLANDSTSKTIAFGNQSSNLSANKFNVSTSPVPEPTSGLLMLLGMAGLALKRKRA